MNKNLVLTLFLLILGVAIGLILADQSQKTTEAQVPHESVTLRLKWFHQAQFTGNYVAKEKGYYANENLEVEIEPVDLKEKSIEALLNNNADFAIAGADEVLIAAAEGKPVKAVAVIYRLSPVVAYSLKSSGIISPKDFVGKKIGLQTGGNIEYLYRTMISKMVIPSKDIKEIAIGHDASELIKGAVDVSTGYVINEPQLAIEAGFEINTMLMADYGANMYADVLVTTDSMITNRPDLVLRMVRATLAGWKYAIENESESTNITMKYATTSTNIHQANMLAASIPLINTGLSKLGWMEQSEWQQAMNILHEQKLISKKIVVSDVFTNNFLENIYK